MRLKVVAILLLAALVSPAKSSAEWNMAGKDPIHTNAIAEGPIPPFQKSWVAKADDPEGSFTTWPITRDGIVYARSAGGVLAIEASTGLRKWWRATQGAKQTSPALGENAIYVLLPNGGVGAFDLASGNPKWNVEVGAAGAIDPSPVLADGLLLFGLPEERALFALDVDDGRVVWRAPFELEPDSVAAVFGDLVVCTTHDVNSPRVEIHALATANGQPVWSFENTLGNSSPSILDRKVILGGGDFFAYAFDLSTGNLVWKSPVEGKFGIRNMPAIAFGDVFLADRIGNIYRLDGETGKRKWIFRDTEGTMDQSFPVIAGKTLFIGSSAGNLYALDTDSGRLLWQDHVNGIVLSGAADSERFYFGVKFGDEGLYAYEHDPEGELEPAPGTLRNLRALIGGVVLFALIFVGVVLYARRRRRSASESAV